MNRKTEVAVTLLALTTSCLAAPKKGGDFVLIDGQVTRLPVMSCKLPDGCVALGKVIWNNNVSDPIRYHIQSVGVADSARSTVSGGFAVSARNPIGGPAQNPEMSVPARLAQWASGEICGIYGLQNLRVLSANAVELPGNQANAFVNSFAVGARQHGIVFTSSTGTEAVRRPILTRIAARRSTTCAGKG